MTDKSHWHQIIEVLSARDIAALYAGYVTMLADLTALSATGRRIKGGLSSRIELAHLYRLAIDQALYDLRESDPGKFNAVWEWLELAQNEAVRQAVERMRNQDQEAA